jgi:phosphoribosylanthranilate isomerase
VALVGEGGQEEMANRTFAAFSGPRPRRTLVKICGVTSPADAVAAVRAGADAVGVNFFAPSPRCVSVEKAREIVEAVEAFGDALVFGVFVDQSVPEMERILDYLGGMGVQLHGDQPPAAAARFRPRPVLRAFRFRGPETMQEIEVFLDGCSALNSGPIGLLLDAYDPIAPGGTGKTLDWTSLAGGLGPDVPWVLAGGLTPMNVGEAVAACRPWGVDVAGGVESSPGLKDREKIEKFVQAVRAADAALVGGSEWNESSRELGELGDPPPR